MSPNDEIHSNYMTGNDYSFTGNERKMFPFCINLPKDLIIVYAKVQLNILSGFGVINFGTLFRLIAQCVGMSQKHMLGEDDLEGGRSFFTSSEGGTKILRGFSRGVSIFRRIFSNFL